MTTTFESLAGDGLLGNTDDTIDRQNAVPSLDFGASDRRDNALIPGSAPPTIPRDQWDALVQAAHRTDAPGEVTRPTGWFRVS